MCDGTTIVLVRGLGSVAHLLVEPRSRLRNTAEPALRPKGQIPHSTVGWGYVSAGHGPRITIMTVSEPLSFGSETDTKSSSNDKPKRRSFEDLGLIPQLCSAVRKAGYSEPT